MAGDGYILDGAESSLDEPNFEIKYPARRRAAAPLTMFSFRRNSKTQQHIGSPSGPLSELSLSANSPSGPMRLGKVKKGSSRLSPYGPSRRSGGGARLMMKEACGFGWDDAPLLTPGRTHSSNFVADKHVIIKKPQYDDEKVGVTFTDTADRNGVLVSGTKEGSVAWHSELLVGELVISVDGNPVHSAEEAVRFIGEAKPRASIFITVAGGCRRVTIDKRMGDCGMTCAATKAPRGVLLKRIAKGSLADKERLYPGDTIVSVNESLVHHHSEAVAKIDQCPVSSLWAGQPPPPRPQQQWNKSLH